MKNKADYSKYECPYSHLEKESGHELNGPEGYQDVYGVWCVCGFRGPVFYLDPDELGLKLKNNKMKIENEKNMFFIPEAAQQWLLTGDRGISSETIFGAITGLVINSRKYPPSDPSDFYRCYKLIKSVPEWKAELYKVAELSNTWKNVIDNWDKLSELLEERIEWRNKGISATNGMYDFMEKLGC